jgi:hypothetical protein
MGLSVRLLGLVNGLKAAEGSGLPALFGGYLREIVDEEVTLPRLAKS